MKKGRKNPVNVERTKKHNSGGSCSASIPARSRDRFINHVPKLCDVRWSNTTVSEMGVEPPVIVSPTTPFENAVNLMKKNGFDQLPVADGDG